MPEEDFHLSERVRSRAHKPGASAPGWRAPPFPGALKGRRHFLIGSPDKLIASKISSSAHEISSSLPFVREVKTAGPYQTLVVTDPGAGRVVSQAIAESVWEDVVGTVNGDSSVLILTENFFFQRLVYERLKYFLTDGGENEVVELK